MQYEIRIMSTKPQTCPLATRNPSFLLFSEELFSDTRLSQQPTGSVHLHIEDWLAGVQRSSRQKKPLKMQNKPNFRNEKMNITSALTKDYENIPPTRKCENKPNFIRRSLVAFVATSAKKAREGGFKSGCCN